MEKSIIYNRMKFVLDGDLLVEIINPFTDRRDVFIPHQFPSGEEINDIGNNFIRGAKEGLHKVTIDNRISMIYPFAFQDANVDEVVWPASCLEIPQGCFECSSVCKVSNIDNVVRIKDAAFHRSDIKSIVWPSKCKVIPRACFSLSKLESISNIEHVAFIEMDAFSGSSIVEFEWPSECKRIPSCCFHRSHLKKITNLSGVTFIGRCAFNDTYLSEPIDLSESCCILAEPCAFGGLDERSVILPYYMGLDIFGDIFVLQS